MIRADLSRRNYEDLVELTLDEDGVDDLADALAAISGNRGVRHVEIETGTGGPKVRLLFESKADREAREKREAEERARWEREQQERMTRAVGSNP